MKRILLIPLFILAGCCPCRTPDLTLPEYYVEGCQVEEGESLAGWWKQFDDSLMSELIEQALSCNYDLRIARERICEARAIQGIEFSTLLPHVDASTLFNRMRNSQTLSESAFTGGKFVNFYQSGFDAIWEIDLFGKNLDRTRAAFYDVVATAELVRDVHVTIAAEVAANYFSIRTLQKRLKIAYSHIQTEKQLVDLTQARFEAGLIPELDVFSAKGLLQERLSIAPTLKTELYQTIYSLAVLIGEIPESLVNTFCDEKSLPKTEGRIPLGLPSELLCRRGDVRSAEFAMRASGARVLAAKKEFFPTLSLSGFYSWATGFFTQWIEPNSRQWSITPSLLLPIFHGGEILSNIRVETSKQRQAVLEYEKSVLKALEEVESYLVGYFQEQVRIEALHKEVAAYRASREMAEMLYTAGKVDFLYVLDTERDLFISENFLAESHEQLLLNFISVYKALGGGWECCDSP